MPWLTVIAPGMLTTIQDLGRWGWQSRGVSVAGPMDSWSHRLANVLVGNAADAATLEATFTGPELRFDDERTVAITGAEFDIVMDHRPVPLNAPFHAPAGSHLSFGHRRRGARAYVAVHGGIAVPRVLGSRATHLPSAMGGVDGRPLQAGDHLPLGTTAAASKGAVARARQDAAGLASIVQGSATLRVIPGPQHERFGADALDVLQSGRYVIDDRSNRMGFRLTGPTLVNAGGGESISDATALGAIQVPPSGQPILLMADRPTTGGYPILATVITADISLAGQLGAGDSVWFVVSTVGEAVAALVAQQRTLLAIAAGNGE